MRVLKFGGSSLATPDRVRGVVRLVGEAASMGGVAVVVSAFGGVTDDLLRSARRAAERDEGWRDELAALRERHREAVAELAPEGERAALAAEVDALLDDLGDLLHGVYLLVELTPRSRDSISAYGERLSALVVAAALRAQGVDAWALDARRAIVTDATFGAAQVEIETTYDRLRRAVEERSGVPVVTGFIAATAGGQTTTLGRGGSDLTASLLGAALAAEVVELWTDVDGVLSADPRVVADAAVLPELSYAELVELSHFGAKVVHPPSVHPARQAGIPLLIKNTFRPQAPGTRISATAPPGEAPIRGITAIPEIALLRLEGDGMVGVPGISERLFAALARHGVNVILISQASSEHSICVAVAPDDAAAARRAVDGEFALERRLGMVDDLVVEEDLAVVAVVGEQMRHRPGLAGALFGALGDEGVNVRAIAQGSSELNVSLVVAAEDRPAAVAAVHRRFLAAPRRRLDVVLLGAGQVGGALLDQIAGTAGALREDGVDLRVVAVATSHHVWSDSAGLDLTDWRQDVAVAAPGEAGWLEELLARTVPAGTRLGGSGLGGTAVVDATASQAPPALYARWLAAGASVVAANKRLFAGPAAAWREARAAARGSGAELRYEATVGAGLPVVAPLAALAASGDRVRRIDAVLSGTLNAVLSAVGAGEPLSAAVRAAHDAGLTEPHPWEDLNGLDVARKLVILGRLTGADLGLANVELADVEIEPLLPGDGWDGLDLEAFWSRLPEADAALAQRRDEAAARGLRLRHVASLADGRARVAVEAVGEGHPAWDLAGADNLVAVRSLRYDSRPLVVRGPGAGPAVTAGGLFADLLALVRRA